MKIGGGRVTVRGCHSGRLKPWTCLVLLVLPLLAVVGAGCALRGSSAIVVWNCTVPEKFFSTCTQLAS